MGLWAQNQASAMAIPVPDMNPIKEWVGWTEEAAPTWVWESEGSGEILLEEWKNSSGIIGENSELLSWKK